MIEAVYYVPRSQVWEGSRGRQSGRVHLRNRGEPRTFCGRKPGWYERPSDETDPRCSRCEAAAVRRGVDWPTHAEITP